MGVLCFGVNTADAPDDDGRGEEDDEASGCVGKEASFPAFCDWDLDGLVVLGPGKKVGEWEEGDGAYAEVLLDAVDDFGGLDMA